MRNIIKNILKESYVEHDESVFYNGGHPIWDKNFREGVSYMFVVDNDSSGPVYLVKDDINSWRPFSVDFFNRFFSKFDYDVTDKLFESENTQSNLRYTLDDLFYLADNNTKLYEILPGNRDIMPINNEIENDGVGNIYYLKRKQSDSLKICWKNIHEGNIEICWEPNLVTILRDFNTGLIMPIRVYNKELDGFNPFENLYESEDGDFSWVDELLDEPMHHILMGKYPREPRLIDEVHTIMFNPPAKINGEKFRKVAYWLEDLNYYPEDMIMEGYTSYVKITRNKHGYENGRYVVGPELNQQELYNLSQSTKKYSHGDWNGNFWYEEFANRFF